MKKSVAWKIAGGFFLVVGILCFIYFLFLLSILGETTKFNYFWLIATLVCEGLGLVITFAKGGLSKLPKWLLFTVEAIVALGCAIFIMLESIIIFCGNQSATEADYIIILGAKVNGTRPSLSLKARLDTALVYLEKYENTKVIVSGGKGEDEGISEAECMFQYLVEHQVDEARIIQENRSTSTKENLEFSKALCDIKKDRIVLVTNDFHVFRSVRIAHKMGYEKVAGQSAPSLWYLVPTNYVREFMAIVKDFLLGNI